MFRIKDRQITSVEPLVYLPMTEGEAYALGEALTMGETAAKCAAAERPTHICAGEATAKGLPAIPVLATTRFEAEYTEKPAIGAAVQLHTDGLQVTAAEGGAFTVATVDEEAKTATGYFR